MSWRSVWSQPASIRTHAATRSEDLFFIRHLGHMHRTLFLQKPCASRHIEFRIACLDAKEKPIRRGVRESLDVEDRMMRLRKFVQRDHADHGENRRPQHCQLEG